MKNSNIISIIFYSLASLQIGCGEGQDATWTSKIGETYLGGPVLSCGGELANGVCEWCSDKRDTYIRFNEDGTLNTTILSDVYWKCADDVASQQEEWLDYPLFCHTMTYEIVEDDNERYANLVIENSGYLLSLIHI